MELAAERNDRHFLRYDIRRFLLPRKQPGIRMRKTPAPSRNTLHIAIGQTDCHLPAEALLHEFDAVVLCIGSGKPRDLDVPGRKGPGVAFALDYLTAATRAVLDGPGTLPDALLSLIHI